MKTSRVLAELAGGHADRTWGTRLRRLARPDLLILDLCRAGHYADRGCRGWPVSWGSVSW
jgi:hypothetical protein